MSNVFSPFQIILDQLGNSVFCLSSEAKKAAAKFLKMCPAQ
jgi:hypothetical protein